MPLNGSFVGIQGAGSGSQTTVGEEREWTAHLIGKGNFNTHWRLSQRVLCSHSPKRTFLQGLECHLCLVRRCSGES